MCLTHLVAIVPVLELTNELLDPPPTSLKIKGNQSNGYHREGKKKKELELRFYSCLLTTMIYMPLVFTVGVTYPSSDHRTTSLTLFPGRSVSSFDDLQYAQFLHTANDQNWRWGRPGNKAGACATDTIIPDLVSIAGIV